MTASVNRVSLTFSFFFFLSHSIIISTLYYIFRHLIILHYTLYILLSFLSFYFSCIPSFLAITILYHLLFLLFLHSFISLLLHLLLTSHFHTWHFHFTNLTLLSYVFNLSSFAFSSSFSASIMLPSLTAFPPYPYDFITLLL